MFDRNAEGVVVAGSYTGLQSGEWGKVMENLGTRDVEKWKQAAVGELKGTMGVEGVSLTFHAFVPF